MRIYTHYTRPVQVVDPRDIQRAISTLDPAEQIEQLTRAVSLLISKLPPDQLRDVLESLGHQVQSKDQSFED